MSGRSRARPTIEQEYIETRPKSRALYERAVRNMPSGVAHDGRVFSPFPFYVERADSARKWDVDGHIYLDYWSGHGALILGHNHPAIVAAITEQAKRGLHYSACHELEVRWAELIRSCVPGAEKGRFTMSAGVPKATLASTLVARHNDLALVTELLSDPEVAAVILEPAGGRSMTVPTNPAFLRALRELTRERGVVLIFDEVVTGLRMAPGGAQEYFGVTADLTCLAKAVAGGLPGAALVGRTDLMDTIAFAGDPKRDRTHRVADQGTYSAAPIVAAAGVAALEILKTGEVQRELNRKGDRLRAGMNQVLKTRGILGVVYGASSIFRIHLGADAHALGLEDWTFDAARLDRGMGPLGAKLHLAMLLNGVDYNRGSANGWLNAAMTDADVDQMVDAFDRSLDRLRRENTLP